MKTSTPGLQTSVLKADKKEAEKLWLQLSTKQTASGKQIFKRNDFKDAIKEGFEITAPYKENGEWVKNPETGKLARKVIFRFEKVGIGCRIDWDEKAITI